MPVLSYRRAGGTVATPILENLSVVKEGSPPWLHKGASLNTPAGVDMLRNTQQIAISQYKNQ